LIETQSLDIIPQFVFPAPVIRTPFELFSSAPAAIQVVSIGGVNLPPSTTGSFTVPDAIVDQVGPMEVVIAGRGIPLGTQLTMRFYPEAADEITVTTTPLVGTVESSTATATVTLPRGFTSGFVEGNW
jgi:hypothetical protein